VAGNAAGDDGSLREQVGGNTLLVFRQGQTVSGTCHESRRRQLLCRTGTGGRGGGMHGPTGGGMPSGNTPEQ
jgi:hypothetical protein